MALDRAKEETGIEVFGFAKEEKVWNKTARMEGQRIPGQASLVLSGHNVFSPKTWSLKSIGVAACH